MCVLLHEFFFGFKILSRSFAHILSDSSLCLKQLPLPTQTDVTDDICDGSSQYSPGQRRHAESNDPVYMSASEVGGFNSADRDVYKAVLCNEIIQVLWPDQQF